jgi:hypothetical protein
MASIAARSQMVNEIRTPVKIIDGPCHVHRAQMTIMASQLPAETMREAIAIRISETMDKILDRRILEAKIPDPTRASGQITTETTEIRSEMAPITMGRGRMPPPISAIRIHPLTVAITGKETRSSRLEDRGDRQIMTTTLRPRMRTTEIEGTQADRISRMEMMIEVLASSRLEDRRDRQTMSTTLRPRMRTTEIEETQADRISRMEMMIEVLASSRLEDRRDRQTMSTTLRSSPRMPTTEIAETQANRINFHIHPSRMEMAIRVLVSSRQEDHQGQAITKVALRIPRSR